TLTAEEVMARANEALLRLTIEAEQENAALQAERQQLIQQASTDVLTGVANRRHFHEFLEEHFRLAARYGSPLSLFLVDLDRFKDLNDTYGHPAGDEVLKGVARRMRSVLRDADLLARFGGEEFVVVLPSTPLEGAIQSAERVREAIAGQPFEVEGQQVSVTASFGVSAYRADALMTPEWLVKEADLALYEAKRAGRNCVRAAGEESTVRF
uniref:GGDEF domain-containing protein n=1 Tax=Tepidiforma sp. TaxID=2682230 RepID=UPI002ADE203A